MAHQELKRYFENLPLTSSLRPKLQAGEIELCFGNHVRVYHYDKIAHENGSCYLTSHQIAWLGNKRKQGSKLPIHLFSLRLKHINSCTTSSPLFSSPKIVLSLKPDKGTSASPWIKLSFRDGMRDKFYKILNDALSTKAWLKNDTSSTKKGFSTKTAGIRGLIELEKKRTKAAETEVDQAFQDLDVLISKAGKMVDLAKKCADGMAARSDVKTEESDRFKVMLADIGMLSPVTRKSAGTKYHEQLARQLADFMQTRLSGTGDVITLPDVFCLFNRARGTEMVSPEDLHNACQLLEALQLPIRFRRFDSNVKVVQDKSHSDTKMSQKIAEIVKASGFISAIDLSQKLGISLLLATQHLQTAEAQKILCRDQSRDGTNFFPNLFLENA